MVVPWVRPSVRADRSPPRLPPRGSVLPSTVVITGTQPARPVCPQRLLDRRPACAPERSGLRPVATPTSSSDSSGCSAYQRYHQGQEEQIGALGLIVNAIVLCNTIYTQRILNHLSANGRPIDEAELERLSPLGTDHVTPTGRYRIALPESLRDSSAYHDLNTPPGVAAA